MIKLIIASLLLSQIIVNSGHAQTQNTLDSKTPIYSFGVVPQQSAERLAILWGPFLTYISEKTGIKLQFKTAKNIPTFEKRLSQGEYDFAYMNPYHFTVYNDKPGYQAMAVRINQPISGILVVNKNSEIKSISDLNNKNIAFPSPAAFAASILPQATLKNTGITYKTRYVSSHDSVYLTVAKGLVDAGGGVKRTLNNTPQAVRDQLNIIWASQKHTPHAFASHPDIETTIRLKIQSALVKMKNDEQGREILRSLKIKHGLEIAENNQWDDIRSLKINLIQ